MIRRDSRELAKTIMLIAAIVVGLAATAPTMAFAQSSTWSATGSMSTARIKHTATLLQTPSAFSPALSCMIPPPGLGPLQAA